MLYSKTEDGIMPIKISKTGKEYQVPNGKNIDLKKKL